MIEIHPEFVIDEHQNRKAVLLPYPEWQKVAQEMEELDDIRAYEEAKRCPSDPMPFDAAVREMRKDRGTDTPPFGHPSQEGNQGVLAIPLLRRGGRRSLTG